MRVRNAVSLFLEMTEWSFNQFSHLPSAREYERFACSVVSGRSVDASRLRRLRDLRSPCPCQPLPLPALSTVRPLVPRACPVPPHVAVSAVVGAKTL